MEDKRVANICLGCLEDKGVVPACPKCGYDERKIEEHPSHLPVRVVLNKKYLVGRVLGQGGFGITYIGFDQVLHKKVAIKEYFPSVLVSRSNSEITVIPHSNHKTNFSDGLREFVNEARNLSKFSRNPSIVDVLDYFEQNGTAYIVMEYIEGDSLSQLLKRNYNKLPYDQAIKDILYPILDALKEVHAKKIYHRDVSPQNIILLKDSQTPILIDFGAARQISGEQSQSLDIVLKPGYSPFESYTSKGNIGPWTDIYACGAVLYQMLTGKIPPSSTDRVLKDDLTQPSDVKHLRECFPSQLNDAILRSLAVRIEDRFQSVEEFKEMLEAEVIGGKSPLPLPPLAVPNKNKKWFAFGGVMCLLVVTAISLKLLKLDYQKESTGEEERVAQEAMTLKVVTENVEFSKESIIATTADKEPEYKPGESFRDCDRCPEMIVVPAGEFLMGAPGSDPDQNPNEGPQTLIRFRKPFAISKTEITYDDWQYCLDSNGCNKVQPISEGFGKATHPVINVSWHETKKFILALSHATNALYRLPSEAEWEYAAGGGSSSRYAWGDQIGFNTSVCEDCGSKWDNRSTAPAASFEPNTFGLFDIHGNVMEWVEDCYADTYFGYPKDGVARSTRACPKRVVRDGHWGARSANIRLTSRQGLSSVVHSKYIGFRIVREIQ